VDCSQPCNSNSKRRETAQGRTAPQPPLRARGSSRKIPPTTAATTILLKMVRRRVTQAPVHLRAITGRNSSSRKRRTTTPTIALPKTVQLRATTRKSSSRKRTKTAHLKIFRRNEHPPLLSSRAIERRDPPPPLQTSPPHLHHRSRQEATTVAHSRSENEARAKREGPLRSSRRRRERRHRPLRLPRAIPLLIKETRLSRDDHLLLRLKLAVMCLTRWSQQRRPIWMGRILWERRCGLALRRRWRNA